MAKPSDFWGEYKKSWYNEVTGKLVEPHRSNLMQYGLTFQQITDMENTVRAEIAEFHRLDRENPLIDNETYNDRRLKDRSKGERSVTYTQNTNRRGVFNPDHDYLSDAE
jgi:hypothetical protein